VAFALRGNSVEVAMLDPEALDILQFLQIDKGMRVLPRLTTEDSIKRALLAYHKHLKEKFGGKMKSAGEPGLATDALLAHALLHRASDVHIEPREFLSGQGELLVRYRIEGALYDAMTLPRNAESILSRCKELAGLSLTLMTPQEGSFKVALENGEEVRVRVSSVPTVQGERMVLHLTKSGAHMRRGFTLNSLGFHGENLERMHTLLHKRSGLVLISGTGKTTALYTMLDLLAAPERAIATVEENVAAHMPHVAQTQVQSAVGLDAAAAVRAALRQDVDVIALDVPLNSAAASLALTAASAGKLLFVVTDALSAASAIEAFSVLGVPRSLVAKVLLGSVGFKVVRRVCQACKESYKLSRVESEPFEPFANFGRVLARLKEEGIIPQESQWKDLTFARAVGCSECEGGYKGEVGLQEVAILSVPLKEAVAEGKNTEEIAKVAQDEGVITLAEDGLFKAAQGITSIEEVARAVENIE
jgi:type II secretory ATPase GspE/PulE/Tfp pilus assembly ATPase PilB-like protein